MYTNFYEESEKIHETHKSGLPISSVTFESRVFQYGKAVVTTVLQYVPIVTITWLFVCCRKSRSEKNSPFRISREVALSSYYKSFALIRFTLTLFSAAVVVNVF
jgi:hypothetical protein